MWTAESWGSDALTPLAWYGARTSRIKLGTSVMQISARTPAATAMAAVTLDHLSGGRLLLGVGVSGPQVAEGWYGTPFAQPLARTREYVDLLRVMWRRQRPARSTGCHFHLDVVTRMGYEEACRRVQELFLDGRRDEAIDAVPDELADAVCLLGPIARHPGQRLQLWRTQPVTTLLVTGPDSEPELRAIRDAVLG